ncbi:hypothetical protein [Enterococcus gallinarum]|uniref:Uncharacterized protein n=1 Tax=Enterococcus gallinarum TaxID=1353 RepID=A0ABD4ZXE4_ENTGA|nr:hypothetical protein [Enterococcus gallinarum]MBF0825254.1 hypothetical protein [Enterococcus faecalis]MBF0726928.1 hypothetical protein [Enterococcus gallinarum]MBF0798899.1 hypothetical protein [Enterococcus gallinarum]MBX8979379.1 hypothetical protein [Enterococcus gallinarum]MDL4876776.1 hypothetical protein [Enterococcus gallinarum]
MEIVQLIEVEGNILTFEDDQGRKIVFPVDKKLAEEYKKNLSDQAEDPEPLLFERSQMELLRR